MGAKRNAYKVLIGNAEGKRPLWRLEDNIKMDLKGIECEGVDWICKAQDTNQLEALVELRVP
jgi:hypothetical protein